MFMVGNVMAAHNVKKCPFMLSEEQNQQGWG